MKRTVCLRISRDDLDEMLEDCGTREHGQAIRCVIIEASCVMACMRELQDCVIVMDCKTIDCVIVCALWYAQIMCDTFQACVQCVSVPCEAVEIKCFGPV